MVTSPGPHGLSINRSEDISLLRCQLRCIYNLFWCKAYSFDRLTGKCYIKEDYLFLDNRRLPEGTRPPTGALGGRSRPSQRHSRFTGT